MEIRDLEVVTCYKHLLTQPSFLPYCARSEDCKDLVHYVSRNNVSSSEAAFTKHERDR